MSELSHMTEAQPSLWKNNPVFVQLLGLSPILALSTSLVLGLALGILTALVFVISAIVVFYTKSLINESWRLATYLIILATVTSIFDIVLQIYWYQLYRDLGIYLPLICCNAILLVQMNKQETFSSLGRVFTSSTSAMGGFMVAMLVLSTTRELLGNGTLFNNWQLLLPAAVEIVPNKSGGMLLDFALLQPGALIILGLLLAAINWFNQRYSKQEKTESITPAKRARVTGKL